MKNSKKQKIAASGAGQLIISFSPREKRALRSLKIQNVQDFAECDLSNVLNLFYVGKTTYLSLVKKQKDLVEFLQKKSPGEKINLDMEIPDLDEPLLDLGLNPREIEALKKIHVETVEDFINCNPERLGSFPGIGKHKLFKLKKIQEEKRRTAFGINTGDGARFSNTLDDYISIFDWTTREFNALRDVNINTVREFLQYEIRLFKMQNKVGKKTYLGLFEKQKSLFEQYGPLLMKEWNELEQPLMMYSDLANEEQNFLTAFGMTSIQEFLFTDLRMLLINEKYESIAAPLIEKQKDLRKKLLVSPDRSGSGGNSGPIVRPVENPLYLLWEKEAAEQSVRSLPFFSNHFNKGFTIDRFHSSFCAKTPLSSLVFAKRIQAFFQKAQLITLGELLLTPKSFMEKYSFCTPEIYSTVRTVLEEFLLDNKHKRFEPDLASSTDFAASLIDFLTHTLKKNDRWTQLHIDKNRRCQILIERAAGKTLDEVGKMFGITRERIRQIEHSIWRQIGTAKARLEPIENHITEILTELGGFTRINLLYQTFAERNKWSFLSAKYFLENFIEILPDRFRIIAHDYVCFTNYRCDQCADFMNVLEEYSQKLEKRGDVLSIEKLAAQMQKMIPEICKCKKCPARKKAFTPALFAWLYEVHPRFRDFRKNKVIRLNPKLGLYESILMALKGAERPLAKKEILAEVQKLNPRLKITEKQIKTTAGNSLQHTKEILLWNRGGMNSESMYVYKDFVKTEAPILEIIERDLLERARKTHVPQMRLNRIFLIHREQCTAQGIPNVYALFACLKCRANPALTFQRSPYIGFTGINQKISNAQILEDYVRKNEGFVTSEALKTFGRSLGLRDEHIQNTISLTNLIATRRGYILFDQFDPAMPQFRTLVEKIEKKLRGIDHLTITEVWADLREQCDQMGILDSRMLYHVLKRFADEEFTLGFPVISLKKEDESSRSLKNQVTKRILRFIMESDRPVSSKTLLDHFAGRLGFPQSAIYKVISGPEIHACGNGTYVHAATIRWTRKKKKVFQELVENYWNDQCAKGIPFGSVIGFYEKYRRKFPPLANRIPWTRTLLCSMLMKFKEFAFWGNNRNIFGFLRKEAKIKSFGDFVKFVLLDKFGKSASLKDLARYLAMDLKAIKRDLTPFMLQGYRGLRIEEGQISVIEPDTEDD
ncbi:MAG: sigma factor-like helix-turn-helix DNA-binding protein [Planctomycetia bacterium]|nr:sigma factor-like helix-turn-helix DNA-binding protein [Planctomycetia bacterium]